MMVKKNTGADVDLLGVEADSRLRQARRRESMILPPIAKAPDRADQRFEAWIWSRYRQVGADGLYGSGG